MRTERGARTGMALLAANAATIFVLSPEGRIETQNRQERAHALAPRAFLAGCEQGNIIRFRHDIGDDVARRIADLVAHEPPWIDAAVLPRCLSAIAGVLAQQAPVKVEDASILYDLCHDLACDAAITFIDTDTEEGRSLLARLARDGMPKAMFEAGFVSTGDFWEPWCVAIVQGEIAAIAFAARISASGAELGVYTFPGFRGQGLAAAVTARWSCLPSLKARRLFYSTQMANVSSQRVTARLRLARIGAKLEIY